MIRLVRLTNGISLQRFMSTTTKDVRSRALIDKVIRVDHAGELGADRIYAGQLAVLGKSEVGPLIKVGWCVAVLVRCSGSRSRHLRKFLCPLSHTVPKIFPHPMTQSI